MDSDCSDPICLQGYGIGELEIGNLELGIGDKGKDLFQVLTPCPLVPLSPCPPALLSRRVAIIAFWTRQGSRITNFFECYKNVVEVTTTVADSRCHPNRACCS